MFVQFKVVKEKYERGRAIHGPHQPLEFESNAITLNIPMDGKAISGWKITPLIRPVVSSCEHQIQPA